MKKTIKKMAVGLVALSSVAAFSIMPTITEARESVQTVTEFQYTGDVQAWTVPQTGIYSLETWGAEGGNTGIYATGGKGGYASGQVSLNVGETIYVYVGESPGRSQHGGWNGGGTGSEDGGTGGGGATDIRRGGTDLVNRIIVAGGGGGGANDYLYDDGSWYATVGGNGGGLEGTTGTANGSFDPNAGIGGTQSSGYSLGQGGNGGSGDGGGGGGGYYGGFGGAAWDNGAGGGGSGYIQGISNGTMQTGMKIGHGLARITLVDQQQADLTGITISERSIRLPIGSATQVYVIAQYSNGSTRDITNQATYKSSNTNVVAAGAAGYISTNGRGNADLTVNYKEKTRAGTTKAVSTRVKVTVY